MSPVTLPSPNKRALLRTRLRLSLLFLIPSLLPPASLSPFNPHHKVRAHIQRKVDCTLHSLRPWLDADTCELTTAKPMNLSFAKTDFFSLLQLSILSWRVTRRETWRAKWRRVAGDARRPRGQPKDRWRPNHVENEDLEGECGGGDGDWWGVSAQRSQVLVRMGTRPPLWRPSRLPGQFPFTPSRCHHQVLVPTPTSPCFLFRLCACCSGHSPPSSWELMAVEVSNPCQDFVLFDFDLNVWPHLDLRYTGWKDMNNCHTSWT